METMCVNHSLITRSFLNAHMHVAVRRRHRGLFSLAYRPDTSLSDALAMAVSP